MSSRLWRNALFYFLILVALLALFNSAQSAKMPAGFLSVFDSAALIVYVVAAFVLLFSGTEGDQKVSRQLRFFCLLFGWSLAYYWPPDARLSTHVAMALVCAGACYLLLRTSGVRRTLALAKNRDSAQYMLAIFCVNLLLAPIILVLTLSPFSTHAAAQERTWTWHALFPGFRFALWATAVLATLIWSINRSSRIGHKVYVASVFMVSLAALMLMVRAELPVVRQVSLDKLAQQIDAGEVQRLVISGNRLRAYTTDGELVSSKETESSALETLRNLGVNNQRLRAITIEAGPARFGETASSNLPVAGGLLLLAAAVVYAAIAISRSNRVYANQITSAPPSIDSDGKPPQVTFNDVGGAKEAKEALQDIVHFLKEPQTFTLLGARMPKGILLEGPPGTGKTLLAQAVAGEANVPFFYMSGSQFVELYVGVGASRVRDLFTKAKKAAPSLIFIDELDAAGQRREGSFRTNQENSQTLNQLLTELDGFEANTQVVVIAATNRADILDEALTRPGRFDRRIHVNPPTREEREAILRIHLKGKPLSLHDKDLSEVSRQAYDMTGAELATVANQSAIIAAKTGHETIQTSHLATAMKQSGAVMPDVQAPALMVESVSQVVVGQESAIRSVASAIYQHYSDLRTIGEYDGRYTAKPNVLLSGPPGTGKSLILRTLAQQLQVPLATVDASAIANNPDNIRVALGRLLTAANNDLRRAKYGIVCIYGIEDLLAPGLVYVQEALGRIIEGTSFDITRNEHSVNSKDVSLSTEHMIFICEGTFIPSEDPVQTFFGSVSQHRRDKLIALGFRPSLLDKFLVIASTEELSADQLLQILSEGESAPLRQYQRRFAAIGTELRFEDGAHHQIVHEARSQGGGARCLSYILEEVLQNDLCSEHPQKEVVITGSMIRNALGSEVAPFEETETTSETAAPRPNFTSEKPGEEVAYPPDPGPSAGRQTPYQEDNSSPVPAPGTGPPAMEIELVRQKDGRVRVVYNGQLSHSFDPGELAAGASAAPLSPSYAEKIYQLLFVQGASIEQDLDSGPKRISIVTTDLVLQEIPWEYACGPSGWVVLKHHFVRGLPTGQRIASPVLDRALHIVAVPATPLAKGVPALNVEGEWLRLKDIIQEVPVSIHLERTYPPTLERLRNLVANRQGGIVHFMGHGKKSTNGTAVLCFENEYGGLTEVTAQDFVQRMNRTVFMVCLNACVTAQPGPTEFSNLAAALAARQIPYALGMRSRMDDTDALTFARVLYGELARGSSVEEAVMQARQELAASSNAEAVGVPVLYTALASPAQGFPQLPGAAMIDEHRPPMELSAIHRAEGLFQGRVDELREIGKRLTGDQRAPILTIHGAGGQGKTVLVRAAVERFAHAWPGGVWAIGLESLPSRATFSRSLARFLDIPEAEQADLAAIERQTLARLDQKRTLVVLDNAETLVEAVDHQDPEALELAHFIRQTLPSQNVSLLITSRVLMGWGEEHLELGGLDPPAGASVFLQSIPRKIGVDSWQSTGWYTVGALATNLSEKLGGYPLGLFLLGKAYHASGQPLAEFVEEFETVLLEARDRYLGDSHRHHTIYACIDASVRCLDDDLRGLLAKLWPFHASFLPEVAVAVLGSQPLFDSYEFRGTLMDIGAPIDLAEEPPNQYTPVYNKMNTDWDFGENTAIYGQLDTLWQRGLLEKSVYTIGDQREASRALLYRLLPTIRSYLESSFGSECAESQPLLARFGEAYAVLIRELSAELSSNPLKVIIVEQSLEDLKRGLTYATGKARLDYLSDLSNILGRFGDRRKSLELAREARQLAEILESAPQNPRRPRSVPEEVENQLQAMNSEALALFDGGQPEKALTVQQQVLSLSRKYDHRTHESNALYNMGQAYQALGQSQEALTAFRQALVLLEKDKDRVGEAKALNGLGLVYLTGLGDHRKALDHFRKARRAWERKDSSAFEQPDQGTLASILNNMGETYRQMGKTAEAIDLFQQALPLLQAVRDPLEAVTLYNLAHIFRKTGKSQPADQFCEQALTASLKVGNRAVEAAVYVDMAQRQPPEKAENLLRKACKIYRETGQAAFEASALASLAMTLEGRSKGRKEAIDEAITLAQRSVRLLEDNHLPQDAGGGKLSQHHDLLKRLLIAQKKG